MIVCGIWFWRESGGVDFLVNSLQFGLWVVTGVSGTEELEDDKNPPVANSWPATTTFVLVSSLSSPLPLFSPRSVGRR